MTRPLSVSSPSMSSTTRDDSRPPRVALLLLGFGGASLELLRPLRDLYAARWPDWIQVCAVRPGLQSSISAERTGPAVPSDAESAATAALTEQLEGIVAATAGCDHLLVHASSNNGFLLWQELIAQRYEAVAPRLRALVCECGPARMGDMTPAFAAQVLTRTIVAAASTLDVPIPTGVSIHGMFTQPWLSPHPHQGVPFPVNPSRVTIAPLRACRTSQTARRDSHLGRALRDGLCGRRRRQRIRANWSQRATCPNALPHESRRPGDALE